MNDETFDKIIKWIFDHHDHHHLEDDEDDNSSKCSEGDFPYVNSLALEDYIFKLAKKDKKEYFKSDRIIIKKWREMDKEAE